MSVPSAAGGSVADGVDELAWMARAACRYEDPELFFPVSAKSAGAAQAAEARDVCLACPVIEQCRDYALRTRQDAGIWGGLTEEQRQALHRRKSGVRRSVGATSLRAVWGMTETSVADLDEESEDG